MLRLPHTLDDLDPPSRLGPPLRLAAVVVEPEDPKPLPHNSGIWKRADGKLETHIAPPPRPPGVGWISRDAAGQAPKPYGARPDFMLFDDLQEDNPRTRFEFFCGTSTGRLSSSEPAQTNRPKAQERAVDRVIAAWQAANGGPAADPLAHMTPAQRFTYLYLNSYDPRS